MRHTDEQEAIIRASLKSRSLVVNALAGSGKTSTAIACVKENTKKRVSIAYLCFNKSVAVTMQEKLRREKVTGPKISTIHAMAFGAVGANLVKGGKELRDLKTYDLKAMDLVPKGKGEDRLLRCVLDLFTRWCGSADLSLDTFLGHKVPKDIAESLKAVGKTDADLADPVKKLWKICTKEGSGPLPHGVYLKLFHMEMAKKHEKIYDLVIVDEAQDLFPVTEAIIRILGKKSRIMLLGDRYQQIYTWNGSVNAIQKFEAESDVLSLTQSFRCPASVVAEASRYLRLLGFKGTFRPAPAECRLKHKAPIIISRTNTSLLANICSCGLPPQKIHLVGGVQSYNFDAISDYLNFVGGKRKAIKSPAVAAMNDVSEYDAYVEATGDMEMKHAQVVVRSLGMKKAWDILIAAGKNLFAESPDKADICLSTGHKCKGSEFEGVQIDASFQNPLQAVRTAKKPDDFPGIPCMAEELRLAYVALTRSTKDLYPGTLLLTDKDEAELQGCLASKKAVLADLDEHGNLAPVKG